MKRTRRRPGSCFWRANRAKRLQLQAAPRKHTSKADQFAAVETMDSMIAPLAHPDKAAMVSLFTPCEMLQVLGLHPYSCEGFGCYLSGTHAERAFLQHAGKRGPAGDFLLLS